jgi:hypothetical protein
MAVVLTVVWVVLALAVLGGGHLKIAKARGEPAPTLNWVDDRR